ncbi:MAG: hypothetical protein JXA09_15075 [Anaerolineae bacterium]|nr:hypothetical protein [Anaerolineae bacterium]
MDTYWHEPQGTFDTRRARYLAYCAAQAPGERTGFFSQIARLALGEGALDEAPFTEALAFIDARQDCSDFTVAGLLRILYLYRASPLIAPTLLEAIEERVLGFKYWWDEAGHDRRCYHTENHQIIFHADELLAGQLYPDQVFPNSGQPGRYHVQHALHLIRRWMDFRVRFGFSEWLSNCYFEEDLLALVNLHDFAQQHDIRARAGLLIDLLLFEMALHTYRGVFGCTHGRTYARLIKGGRSESSASTAKLMFGMGLYTQPNALGAVPLATSGYRCPPLIAAIAADLREGAPFRERHSIDLDDAPRYGLSYDDLEDGHLYWSIQDYLHPEVIELSKRLSALYGVRLHEDYGARYRQLYQAQIEQHGRIVERSMDCHALTEVHVETYRTPSYMLSCAQDYRPGKAGYQQHIWQATLGIDAVLFTNHPGSLDERSRPNFWAGNGVMPRAAQRRNVLVCIHRVPADDALPYSHAYLPRDAFDEVVERGPWICARRGDGYAALYASQPWRWLGEDEVRVDATDVAWVCEMGDRARWGAFSRFVEAVTAASIHVDEMDVRFASPSAGAVRFGWQGPFLVGGEAIPLHDSERFENRYCTCAFGAPQVEIAHQGQALTLDFQRNERVEGPAKART